ncbi:alpha/beta hydrolase [Pseudoxanthomonas sp. PXM01]|uniref:alpha/beta fold hydrolase n=1 Tax=Pseudoxanthomonas sp. PXM01 TaxID=2769295 RepID=UPI00177E9455|nr:alpha/beta hydrolase [Pseudoxanthomonas sp. PXM01]MBD9467890.1 alpha/beta hydrolase [Pseudoxanthomonas sp. PXM01]
MPGLDGTGRLYAPLAASLAQAGDAEVLAYDNGQFQGYSALADAIEPALLRRNDDIVLVAESFAGPLGVLLAHRHPGRVRALVMAASFVRAPLPLSRVAAALVESLPAIAPPLFVLERLLTGSGLPPSLRAEFEVIVASVPLPVLRQRAVAALRVDVSRELAALDMPVLYLQARHDRLIWPHAGRDVLRLARHARHAVVDAPHFLFQVAPVPAAVEIGRLLDVFRDDACV